MILATIPTSADNAAADPDPLERILKSRSWKDLFSRGRLVSRHRNAKALEITLKILEALGGSGIGRSAGRGVAFVLFQESRENRRSTGTTPSGGGELILFSRSEPRRNGTIDFLGHLGKGEA
jgi:hypothetical protein